MADINSTIAPQTPGLDFASGLKLQLRSLHESELEQISEAAAGLIGIGEELADGGSDVLTVDSMGYAVAALGRHIHTLTSDIREIFTHIESLADREAAQ